MELFKRLTMQLAVMKFSLKSLTYDSCRPPGFYTDAAFEPVFWTVDHVAGVMGLVFVVLVTILISTVVGIWYKFLLPIILTSNWLWISFHCLCSHWLLMNIVFHYFKAVFTDPGLPPQGRPMDEVKGAVICRKCIQPKPPRTHHCSVCNRCVLKMDHHCPWMNNCIGFYNHRYFVLFCGYMWLGTVYVCSTSWSAFAYHFFNPANLFDAGKRAATKSVSFGVAGFLDQIAGLVQFNESASPFNNRFVMEGHPAGFDEVHSYEHVAVIYLFLMCSAVTVALGLLNMWHFRLLWKGQTSIEIHINRSERKKAALKGMGYHNPHDFGWKQNLRSLLGMTRGRSIMCVLFPSAHKPQGDGLSWPPNPRPSFYYDASANKKLGWFTQLRRACPV